MSYPPKRVEVINHKKEVVQDLCLVCSQILNNKPIIEGDNRYHSGRKHYVNRTGDVWEFGEDGHWHFKGTVVNFNKRQWGLK